MDKQEIKSILRAFPYPSEDYWVITGAAMVLYGIKDHTPDIDLGCSKELADRLEAEGCLLRRSDSGNRWFKYGERIEIIENWLRDSVVRVEGLPVVTAKGLIEMKQELGREKDIKDIQLIREYMKRTCSLEGDEGASEAGLYKKLGLLTKDRDRWKESIPYVASLLGHGSEKIQAKALWLLGEMGLAHPLAVKDAAPAIAAFCDSPAPLLRERAAVALGRIGRADFRLIRPYWADLFRLAADGEARVRLSFVWASENIAVNTPDIYADHMPVFEKLLHDADDRVRMEAPEMFRVLAKRRPELVRPFLKQLRQTGESAGNRVVRLHCLAAVREAEKQESPAGPGQAAGPQQKPIRGGMNGRAKTHYRR